ncbi:MAG TPA: reverse transcriptase domain-containing protein [Gemmataceae bacterium]|jgi:uncharacterized protein (TIGR03067 family)|nr:reverse transcriptase domain-containing protein [Gemmataceae bacterium]
MGLWSGLKAFWHWLRHGSGHSVEELARRLGYAAAMLRAVRPSYREVLVPKRSSGRRRLCVPDDALKALQRRILQRLLRRLRCHPAVTGFQRGESIVTHARRHVGRAVLVRLDLKDFFPSTGAGRVYRYLRKIGWNRPAARLLTRICTHRGGLPQGAPTSPRLSNLVNYRLDCRLAAMARKLGAGYSRYADDLTLSFPVDDRDRIRYLIRFARRAAADEGYVVHGRKKLHIRRRHQQQRVTGLVVNECVQLPRATRRWLRAVEHHLRTSRPATLTPGRLAGWRAFQQMIATQAVDPAREAQVRAEQDALQGTWLLVAVEEKGKSLTGDQLPGSPADRTWIFQGDRLLFRRGDVPAEASYRPDPTVSPKTVALTLVGGPERGTSTVGLYALEEDTLRLCLAWHGKTPTVCTTGADSAGVLFVLKRAATEAPATPAPGTAP